MPSKSLVSDGVERLLSMALRFLPAFECRRERRFQVLRVLEAIAGAFLAAPGEAVNVHVIDL